MAELLHHFYDLIHDQGRFFTDDAIADAQRTCYDFMGAYGCLASEALEQRRRGWKMTPKFHLFMHVCQPASLALGNPRFAWTYMDEDNQQNMAKIAKSCHINNLASVCVHKWSVLTFARSSRDR